MNVAVLHDEVERLKAELAQTQEALAQSEEARRRLESIVSDLQREKFGARSEKLSAEQYHLPLEDVEIAQGVLDAAHEKAQRIIKSRSDDAYASHRRNRGHLPAHLPRVERIIEPQSRLCPCGCGEMARIGEDVSERLDVVPAQLRVLVTRRPKYACRRCSGTVVQAHAPEHVVPGGLPTEALIAQVIVAKFGDHLPFYRQAEIYARQGIRLDRATLGNWAGRACFHLKPIAERMRQHLAAADRLFMDETTAPVLDPGRGKVRKGFFWAIASDDRGHAGQDPPIVLFHYAPGRSGEHAERFLQGFRGQFLQVDAYRGMIGLPAWNGRRGHGGSSIAGPTYADGSSSWRATPNHPSPKRRYARSRRSMPSRQRFAVPHRSCGWPPGGSIPRRSSLPSNRGSKSSCR